MPKKEPIDANAGVTDEMRKAKALEALTEGQDLLVRIQLAVVQGDYALAREGLEITETLLRRVWVLLRIMPIEPPGKPVLSAAVAKRG